MNRTNITALALPELHGRDSYFYAAIIKSLTEGSGRIDCAPNGTVFVEKGRVYVVLVNTLVDRLGSAKRDSFSTRRVAQIAVIPSNCLVTTDGLRALYARWVLESGGLRPLEEDDTLAILLAAAITENP